MSTEIMTEEQWEAKGLGIAGRQLVKTGIVEVGDLLVSKKNGSREIYEPHYAYESVRSYRPYARIYRKITVPKQGDCDHVKPPEGSQGVGWDEIRAKTYDDGKPPLARLPWAAIKELSMVQLYGQQKYGDFDNYRKGMELTRNLSCALRHISEYCDGRDNDPESGRSHLGHALCRIAFVLQNLADGTAIDDRYKKP